MDTMDTSLLSRLNSPAMYGIVALAIGLVVAMCVYFMVKSWRAGVKVGMDKAITFVGSGKFMEIWDTERFSQFCASAEADFAANRDYVNDRYVGGFED